MAPTLVSSQVVTAEGADGGIPTGTREALKELSTSQLSAPEHADAALQLIRDIADGRAVVLRIGDDVASNAKKQAFQLLLQKVVLVCEGLESSRQEAAIERLAEIILPNPLADARGLIASDNLAIRDRFVAETRPLTSAELGELAGASKSNPYATAHRWRKSGQAFSVHHRHTEYFPAFQFRDGRPHPNMRKILAALPVSMTPWQRAFWFVSANGWLGDAAPVDRLDDLEAVIAAAQREAQEVIG